MYINQKQEIYSRSDIGEKQKLTVTNKDDKILI